MVDKEQARAKIGHLGTREDRRILEDSGWCKGVTISDTDVLPLLSDTLSLAQLWCRERVSDQSDISAD